MAHQLAGVGRQLSLRAQFDLPFALPASGILLAAGWALTLALLVIGWRRPAAIAAVVAALGSCYPVIHVPSDGWSVTALFTMPLVLGLVAAGALVVASGASGPILPARWLVPLTIGCGLLVAASSAPRPLNWYYLWHSPYLGVYEPDMIFGAVPVAIVLVILTLRTAGPVRRRLIALAAPVVADVAYHNRPGSRAALDTYLSGATELLVVVLALVAGVAWVAWRERIQRLLALERASDLAAPG